MLKTKRMKQTVSTVVICALLAACGTSEPADKVTGAVTPGLTIQKEKNSDTLYVDALNQTVSENAKYTTVRRGEFVTTVTVPATIIYPNKKTIRYDFPYGTTYYLEAVEREKQKKSKGDPIARIYVVIDETEIAELERQIQRMEERGETESDYDRAWDALEGMREAVDNMEIVMKQDGILLEQESIRFGSVITSYTLVVAEPEERLLEVSNENKQFRYGQTVTVTAKVDGKACTGTGTVITASPDMVSEDLAGAMAYIRLAEDSEYLFDGTGLSVTAETVHVKDALLVDVSATYMKNGVPMVKVKDENGLHAVTFSFGRKNETDYWVIDGLEEGAQVLVQ